MAGVLTGLCLYIRQIIWSSSFLFIWSSVSYICSYGFFLIGRSVLIKCPCLLQNQTSKFGFRYSGVRNLDRFCTLKPAVLKISHSSWWLGLWSDWKQALHNGRQHVEQWFRVSSLGLSAEKVDQCYMKCLKQMKLVNVRFRF